MPEAYNKRLNPNPNKRYFPSHMTKEGIFVLNTYDKEGANIKPNKDLITSGVYSRKNDVSISLMILGSA